MYKDVIDTQKGIAYMAGKKEIYAKIASAFTRDLDAKIDKLMGFFDNRDFTRLTIEFHGLKSSAASVGSTVLPDMCLELEKAGKEDNNEYIIEQFEGFIEQYRDTCGALNEVIAQL